MPRNPDVPPSQTTRRIDPPPFSGRPTAAQLQADIDSGRTGDKNEVFDPGLAPLGTDDEAAGRQPEPARVAIARRAEGVERWSGGSEKEGDAHKRGSLALYGFLGLIVVVALAFLLWIR